MRIRRHFTVEGQSPYTGLAFRNAASEIRNPDGSIVFAQGDIEVPEGWSQVASDVLAQKYFRKAGVPRALKPVPSCGQPKTAPVRRAFRVPRRASESVHTISGAAPCGPYHSVAILGAKSPL